MSISTPAVPQEFDDLPFLTLIDKTDFTTIELNDIDAFLHTHRFTELSVIIEELSTLSTKLNTTLLEMVNHDYNDFIKLGKSINGGLEMINTIAGDMWAFKTELLTHHDRLTSALKTVDYALAQRLKLTKIKTLSKVSLILDEQITSFEMALQMLDDGVPDGALSSLQRLTGIYTSVSSLYDFLQTTSEGIPPANFTTSYLASKVAAIRHEFLSYLDSTLKLASQASPKDADLILQILNVCRVVGHEAGAIGSLGT